jgi:hypothetical protein
MGPMISKRVAAGLRKRALVDGTFGGFQANQGILPLGDLQSISCKLINNCLYNHINKVDGIHLGMSLGKCI